MGSPFAGSLPDWRRPADRILQASPLHSAPVRPMPVQVGTSGWSYDDWEGHVYPKTVAPSDRLAFYAERFPTVEVDSTYYRDPAPGVVKGWIEKTRALPSFELSVKAPKALTHEALVDAPLGEVERVASAWRALVADPLAEARRLGAILLQLSPALVRHGGSLDRLDVALAALRPHRCAVEFRNRTWHDERPGLDPDTLALLASHGACAVVVDGPPFPAIVEGAAAHAYVRFHGRNVDRWSKRDEYYGERYDYLYSEEELRPWATRVGALARDGTDVRVYFNNHVEGKSFRNGGSFEQMLEAEGASVVRARSPQRRLF